MGPSMYPYEASEVLNPDRYKMCHLKVNFRGQTLNCFEGQIRSHDLIMVTGQRSLAVSMEAITFKLLKGGGK